MLWEVTCPHQESFVGHRGHTVRLASSFTASLVGKNASCRRVGICCVISENKTGEKRGGWSHRGGAAAFPPRTVHPGNRSTLRSRSLQSISLRFSLRGNAIPDTDLHVERATDKSGVCSGVSREHRVGGAGFVASGFYFSMLPITTASRLGLRTGRVSVGTRGGVLGRAMRGGDGVARALQERSWSVWPEGSNTGRYIMSSRH